MRGHHRSPSTVFALILCVALSACATSEGGRRTLPIGPVLSGPRDAEILVVTNRLKSESPELNFTGERDDATHILDVTVSVPPAANRKPGRLKWRPSEKPKPEKAFHIADIDPLTASQLSNWLGPRVAASDGHILLFVHGYNTGFEPGIFLFSQLLEDSKVKATPVSFSWPSRGKLLAYNYDRESATYARTALADLIDEIAEVPEVSQVTILSHSMGGWLTMEALRTLALKHGIVPQKVRSVVLASPDIDVYVFGDQFITLEPSQLDFTILVSQDDMALRASRWLGGNVDRLGRIDLQQEPYSAFLEHTTVRIIDVSSVDTGTFTNHRKFSESPEIVQLIGKNLINGQKLSDEHAGLLERLGVLIAGGTKAAVEQVDSARSKVSSALGQ